MIDAPTLESFRTQVRDWFVEHRPPSDWARELDRATHAEYLAFNQGWLRTLNREGLGAPHVGREWGGGGYTLAEQPIVYEEWARARAPGVGVFVISLHHVPSTLIHCGTPAQQAMVHDAIDGTVWCQGFSEPDAGSDLASLRTRAVRDGDDYVVTGQKIWSSHANFADWCLLLARTNPDVPKHQGISYFIMDMHAPGVEVRPIRQATGHAEFCEIHLDEVRIPAHQMIGGVGEGWTIAQRTLSTERGPITIGTIEEINAGIDDLRQRIDDRYGPAQTMPLSDIHHQVALVTARARGVRSLGLDVIEMMESGADAGNLSSVIKVAMSDALHALHNLASTVDGPESIVDPQQHVFRNYVSGDGFLDYIGSWGWSIAGGTNEIQRNIISERILGLPKEPRP